MLPSKRVVEASLGGSVEGVEVDVAKGAGIGPRDVGVAGMYREGAAVVYDKIDAIKVRPQAGMARVGGIQFPKEYAQFEAVAYSNGADGKPRHQGRSQFWDRSMWVFWSIEEYTATFDDEDKQYVGTIDDNGLFTPNVDGPNLKRRNHADTYGDVWVIATYKLPDGKVLRARAHLLVTVPLYIRFDQPEVAP